MKLVALLLVEALWISYPTSMNINFSVYL